MNDTHTPCPDCGVTSGQTHRAGCDVERCAACGGQRLSCACNNTNLPRLPWTGEWPGTAECREFGFYVRLVPDRGWVPCSANTPGAVADFNRLYSTTRWDPQRGRFVRD